ncbi:hypothetical protein B0O80DRAFT_445561 [Mortierella sp. GBAus27b]|nr:hypothetical protein B0O80DRAFT_445561 [Mortierella sp. GBAus27b]
MARLGHIRHLIIDCAPHPYHDSLQGLIRPILITWRSKFDLGYRQGHDLLPGQPLTRPITAQDKHGSNPSTYLDIQYNHADTAVLFVKVERSFGLVREFTYDMAGLQRPNNDGAFWIKVFDPTKDLASPLTALRLKNLHDDSWLPGMLEWIQAVRRKGGHQVSLQELRLDCRHIGSARFWMLCEFIDIARSTLLSVKLVDVYPAPAAAAKALVFGPSERAMAAEAAAAAAAAATKGAIGKQADKDHHSDSSDEEGQISDGKKDREEEQAKQQPPSSKDPSARSDWRRLFRSLDFGTLTKLHIERANLADEDMTTLVDCLVRTCRHGRSLALKTLYLFNTQVEAKGMKELVMASSRYGWDIKVDIRAISTPTSTWNSV